MVRAGKYKLGARAGIYKLGTRAGKYKLEARVGVLGQDRGPSKGPGAGKHKDPEQYAFLKKKLKVTKDKTMVEKVQ